VLFPHHRLHLLFITLNWLNRHGIEARSLWDLMLGILLQVLSGINRLVVLGVLLCGGMLMLLCNMLHLRGLTLIWRALGKECRSWASLYLHLLVFVVAWRCVHASFSASIIVIYRIQASVCIVDLLLLSFVIVYHIRVAISFANSFIYIVRWLLVA